MPENDPNRPLVLVVDDDRTLGHLLQGWLEKEGYRAQTLSSGEAALSALRHTLPDAICLDLHMPGMGGLEVLEVVCERHPGLPVLILTSDSQIDTVVSAMKLGAFDYLTKPVKRSDLLQRLHNSVDNYRMSIKLAQLEREVEGKGYPGIIGTSPKMRELYRQMDRLRSSDITVLIHGESGTGKELIAQAIHGNSSRRGETFVPVNCAAIPDTLQESELFGHEKGSFTGATTRRIGRFEQAHRGTLFLDEIAELNSGAQAKVLRVIQERRFLRVGGNSEIASDFRLVAATHRSLEQQVREGDFRQDLFFRVAVFELHVPPLRERSSDIPALARRFLGEYSPNGRSEAKKLSDSARDVLLGYRWPGNVRELQNVLQRAVVLAEGPEIQPEHLPDRLRDGRSLLGFTPGIAQPPSEPSTGRESRNGHASHEAPPAVSPHEAQPCEAPHGLLDLKETRTLDEVEKAVIAAAIERTGGNLSRVCRELGIGRTTLYRKIKQYGLRD